MKEFKKGLLFGLGIITPILVIVISIISVNALNYKESSLYSNNNIIIDTNTPTKYVWIDDQPSVIKELSSNINIVKDKVIVDTYKWSPDGGKTLVDMPVYKNGYVITFKTIPLATDIEKLDLQMSLKNMKRVGGKTVLDSVQALETKVTTLESKVR